MMKNHRHSTLVKSGLMRRVLVDHARGRGFAKRGGEAQTLAALQAVDRRKSERR